MSMIWLWVSDDFYTSMNGNHDAAIASAKLLDSLDGYVAEAARAQRHAVGATHRISQFYLGEL